MESISLKKICSISKNQEGDRFVGIRCQNGDVQVYFPLGYHLSDDDRAVQEDIFLLFTILSSTTAKKDSRIENSVDIPSSEGFPFQAYFYVLCDYFSRGYYRERETSYAVATHGKIDWGRTIKTQKFSLQGDEAYYLQTVRRRPHILDNELITLIHEYCVYDSFVKIGWLFTSSQPKEPRIKFDYQLFRRVLYEKLGKTNQDQNKFLFVNMLAIVEARQPENLSSSFWFGTDRFEYVWENLINHVFGEGDKSKYLPRTEWFIYENGQQKKRDSLQPDTIMELDGDIYILDAKYYSYCVSHDITSLPETSSIGKQIIYGEYVDRKNLCTSGKIYNAFLIPFDEKEWQSEEHFIAIGEATADWKQEDKEYERVVAVLIDVKYLMNSAKNSQSNRRMLAECIKGAIDKRVSL